jgi:Uncharacterized conserved protein
MRSVIRRRSSRCPRCQLTVRWCVCAAETRIETPLALTLLTHPRERTRPTSSGNLISRVFANCTQVEWDTRQPPRPESLIQPQRELWILHPQGHRLPEHADPSRLQLMLLDGAWTEAATMAKSVVGWGRLVSLPLSGESSLLGCAPSRMPTFQHRRGLDVPAAPLRFERSCRPTRSAVRASRLRRPSRTWPRRSRRRLSGRIDPQ